MLQAAIASSCHSTQEPARAGTVVSYLEGPWGLGAPKRGRAYDQGVMRWHCLTSCLELGGNGYILNESISWKTNKWMNEHGRAKNTQTQGKERGGREGGKEEERREGGRNRGGKGVRLLQGRQEGGPGVHGGGGIAKRLCPEPHLWSTWGPCLLPCSGESHSPGGQATPGQREGPH